MPRVHRSKSTFMQVTYPASKTATVNIQNLNRGYGAFSETIMDFKLKDTKQNFYIDLLNTN
jgi:hypothetical protein